MRAPGRGLTQRPRARDHAEVTLPLTPHHAATVEALTRQMAADPTVHALVLGGSLAHGFAAPDADVDVTILVSTEEYEQRVAEDRLHYNDRTVVTYEGGYVDGKYVDLGFLRRLAEHGSDPARWAYEGARVLFSHEPALAGVLEAIVRYPIEQQDSRRGRFAAQLLAWRWYFSQSVEKDSAYLRVLAQQRLVLFACRLVLNENATLYPFHKWLLRVTEQVPHRPTYLMTWLDDLLTAPSQERADDLVADLFDFYGIDLAATEAVWPTRFMKDTELSWLTGHPPVDDL